MTRLDALHGPSLLIGFGLALAVCGISQGWWTVALAGGFGCLLGLFGDL